MALRAVVFGNAIVGAAVIALLTLAGSLRLYDAAQVFVSAAIALTGYAFLHMVARMWRGRNLEYCLVSSAALVVLVLGVRDWVLILGFIDRPSGQYTQYAVPLLLAMQGLVLVNRFVQALRAGEHFTSELEARVQAKSRELERRHEEIQQLERERTLALERERLMRDMHDGAGGHLVSSLALLKSKGIDDPDLAAALTGALTDLRLMIDSLDPVDDDLNAVLGMLRDRMQPILKGSGLRVTWQIERLPALPDLGPHLVLQILRILQEALTNVIRHAAARHLTVSARFDPSLRSARLCVQDDGRGLEGAGSGRGLKNMRTRTGRLGATLRISSDASGTLVCLEIPYAPRSVGEAPEVR